MTTKNIFTSQPSKTFTEILPKRSFKGLKNPLLDLSTQRAASLQRVRRVKGSSWRLNQFSKTDSKTWKTIRERSCLAKKGQKARLSLGYSLPFSLRDMFQIRRIFERIHSLQDIRLDCQGSLMTDEHLDQLCQGLKRCRSLKKLSLCFENLCRITDQGFDDIMESLKKLVSLRYLRLSFPVCPSVSDVRMHDIIKALKRLKFLKNIYIDFTDCQNITDAGIEFLCKETEKLPFLQKFEINILTCGKVHPRNVKQMKKHKAVEFIYEKVFVLASKKEEEEAKLGKEEEKDKV